MMEINRTVPRKLKISSFSVRKENDCFPSSKNQIEVPIIREIKRITIGKIRQQSLLVFIKLKFKNQLKIVNYSLMIIDFKLKE